MMRAIMWDELWIEKEVSGLELATAIAAAHGLAADQVVVVDGIASELPRAAPVEVYRMRGAGEFATRIQLAGAGPLDRPSFCARLASALGCRVLGDDGSVNAFTFMLFEPGGATRVRVDAQKIEAHVPVVLGPYVHHEEDEGHPTKPIRRYPLPTEHRTTRGGQIAQLHEYTAEGLPRPPLVAWTPQITELYAALQRLLGQLAYRAASDDELEHVRAGSAKLRATFPDPEQAGWFVVEVLEAAAIVLAEPWDPEKPAVIIEPSG